MRIVQLTPGTGTFYCAACIRDNSLVTGLRERGHDAVLVPLYLPFVVDEDDASAGAPILLGGVNMYLQQVSRLFRRTPRFLDRLFDARPLLRFAARRATMTTPEALGEMTISTLRGESGNQAKEVDRLAAWIAEDGAPDVVCLSNVLLAGLVRRIRQRVGPVKVVASLQGEDVFLDGLPEPARSEAWAIVRERCREIDAFLPVSRTHGDAMTARLGLDPDRVHPVYPGIRVGDFEPALAAPSPPVVGYLARMSRAKGLPTLVAAFLEMHREGRVPGLALRIGGSLTAADRPLRGELEARIAAAGASDRVEWRPNLSRAEKLSFLRELTVLSVPATHGEDFGLYVIEALASGVPVVQPRHGAFPELIAATGGGTLCEPDDPADLARALTGLLLDPDRVRDLGAAGREAVVRRFSVARMTEEVLGVLEEVLRT